MKTGNTPLFWLLVLSGIILLFPNYYQNKWGAVESVYYEEWQIRYDRLVIARLVENDKSGFFSAGGLLGLGDTTEWNFRSATHEHQFNTYIKNGSFQSYLIYKSNPGFQGVVYGLIDKFVTISQEEKIILFRGITAFLSASALAFIFAFTWIEFGALAGILTLLFSVVSIWIVLPAGSIFWNLWAFYLPFIAGLYLFSYFAKTSIYHPTVLYIALYATTLLRILLSGFDLMTTELIMATVPIIYYAIFERWGWKIFTERFIKVSIVLIAATVTGLTIMSFQIAKVDHNIDNIFSYIWNRFGSHFAGNSEYYLSGDIEATKIGIGEVIQKYLVMPAINIPLPGDDTQVLYWHIIFVFVLFTLLYFLFDKQNSKHPGKTITLITTTWVSLLAPISWLVIFRPHSIIHTHVNTMGWQMPFTLLGFAMCGQIVTELVNRKAV